MFLLNACCNSHGPDLVLLLHCMHPFPVLMHILDLIMNVRKKAKISQTMFGTCLYRRDAIKGCENN